MASSSRNPRPASPVEGDLQKLYNEVWAVFSEENNNQSSERDLENIYNGYADIPSSSVNPQLQPPYSRIGRSPSPAPVNTRVEPSYSTLQSATSSSQSPTRRRLPPTPGGSTSSAKFFSPPTFPMPEPTVYHSAVELPSSDLGRRTTASSDNSVHSRRLPVSPTYTNGSYRFLDDGERTPDRSDVLGPYINERPNSTNPAASVHHRPPGPSAPALPPKPAGYNEYSYASSSNPYLHDGSDVYDDYQYEQKHVSSTPPPPPPPKLPQHINERYYDANAVEFSDFNLKNGSLKNEYFDRDYAASSSDQPEAGPSSIQTAEEQQNWDPSAYGNYEDQTIYNEQHVQDAAGHVVRRPTDMLRTLADYSGNAQVDLADEETEGYWEEDDEDDESRFVNYSLLSHIAMQLRDKVTRGTHVKGSIPYPRAFTGKDIVSTIQTQIQRELAINHGVSTNDRRVALQAARSLQSQLFFYEVEWGNGVLKDGVEDVYMFMGDMEGGSDAFPEAEELPTGVITMLTRCYSPSCVDGIPCYSYTCPRRGNFIHSPSTSHTESPIVTKEEDEWAQSLDPSILAALPKSEINRQNIIHKLIAREKQYLQDLDIVETVFIKGIRTANPPVLQLDRVEDLIDDIFGNILDLRETNRRLLEVLSVRQREEGPIIQRIGDIFLGAADEFRYAYPIYIGHYHVAEKRLKEETDTNSEFRLFLEQCSRQLSSRSADGPRLDLKHFLNRPSEHLQKYPVLLEAVQHETAEENPDSEFLREAIEAIKNLQLVAQLRTFQAAMGKGTPGKWEWHDIVPSDIREKFSKKETKRQSIIFELIKGEMSYVKDLENIYTMYIEPLRKAEPPIIPRDRLDQFIDDVFHNYMELYEHHKKLVDNLHEIQREQHPHIRSITAALFDAALNFRDAYMEYIPNYPIAAYRIDDEMANNLPFKTFVDQCVRHPDAHRLDMKNFINRPIPRLLRYELLLKGIMEESPPEHEDHQSIPNVIDVIKALGKETEPGVQSAKQKVEVWRYNANLQFKQGESIDLDLLNPNRSLIHSGKLLRQPDSGLEWNGWSELHVLLFDNYLVMTKTKEKEGVTKYQVNRRPIPLDLLTLVSFSDPPTQRSTGILRNLRVGERHDGSSATPGMTPESANDSRSVFPLTIHHNGRMGGPYILYAESAQIRAEWKLKLEEALGLRKAVQESNKVFEVEYLSRDTFMMPSLAVGNQGPTWNQDNQYTGKVTCSVPFNTPDGRALVAIGCTEGVWIGFRHDPKSIRRVLHLKMVTQCAMLEDFGIFLVLADKALFAYHIEALVPSTPHGAHTSQVPQKLSGTKDVHFFSVGTLQGRTLIIYMKKKSLNSIFRVLEPVGDKINEGVKAPAGFGSRLGFRSAKSEWFRIYRDFFLPSDSFDVIFLKARIAIFCAKGFEIMNLHDFDSITIPQREDPRHAHLAKRCENARPLGMFRSTEEEFLLCYDEFGLYVDKHGDPCRSFGIIEWEGTAERVAFHAPYILLFDSRFIEIRHIESGRLAQIIPGNEIRCIWDGRGISPPINSIAPDPNDENAIQEAQVHFVMNSTEVIPGPGGTRSRNIVQHVCELIPTVPLYPTPAPISAASVSSIPQQLQYSRYGTGPTHMPTHSYASSSASTAQLYVPTASSQYTPPSPANSSYTYVSGQPQPSPSNSYYTRTGYYENSQHGAGSIHRI